MKPWTRKAGGVGGEQWRTCCTVSERIEKAPKIVVDCVLQPETGEKVGLASRVMDEAAFQAFYTRTARRLRGYLNRSLGDPSLADDLMQEAYLRLLRSGLKTDDDGHRKAYLFRIATNLVRDHFRRRRPEYELPPDLPGKPGFQSAVDHRSDVAQAMSGLAPRDRQMLWLAYVEGSSHQEIATALGLKPASLKSMLSRARHRMADRLKGLGLQPVERSES